MQDITGEVYKGAEARAQTGHRSGGQVQLVHAAVFECVTPACICVMQCNVKYSSVLFMCMNPPSQT